MAGNCCMAKCDDPACLVCTVNARFPLSTQQMATTFARQKMVAAMTDLERDDYYAKRRTSKGRTPRADRKADFRDGTPRLAGGR